MNQYYKSNVPYRIQRLLVLLILSFSFIVVKGCEQNDVEQASPKTDPPNIIVMYSDDHTAQAVGAYQDALNYGLKLDHTPTPNIDRLVENGIRFDNAFVTNSICVPSRAVMLSGLHSHVSGVFTNMEPMPTDLENFRSSFSRMDTKQR